MRALPDAVRARVLALAAEHLGSMPVEQVPSALLPVRAFTPARPGLQRCASGWRRRSSRTRRSGGAAPIACAPTSLDLAAAGDAGVPRAALDPVERGAAVYLLRPDGWEGVLDEIAEELRGAAAASAGEALDTVGRHTAQLERQRARTRAGVTRAADEVRSGTTMTVALRPQSPHRGAAGRGSSPVAAGESDLIIDHRLRENRHVHTPPTIS